MKFISFWIICFLFPLSLYAAQIGDYEIKIKMKNKHLFLVDHGRELVIMRNGKIIDTYELYLDSGSRVPLNAFEENGKLLFIDCNGYWLIYDEENQKLINLGWFWQKDLPANYIGTFRLRKYDKEISFQKESEIDKTKVYLYKDP